MCKRNEGSVSESFVKGLDVISEDKGPKFSARSKEAKSLVRNGLL